MATTPGNLYIIAAPSGTGKTTLVKALTNIIPDLTVSISHTTRPIRPAEQDGINYYFVPDTTFNKMIKDGDFLEYATIFQHLYGTSRRYVEQTLAQGLDVILEIDWQGSQQIKRLFPDCVSVFILPPSMQDLAARLKHRNQDKPEIIEQRLADARKTIAHIPEFDYLVINNDFDKALEDLVTIIYASRLRQKPQSSRWAKIIADFG